jgi:DUF1009 family protein
VEADKTIILEKETVLRDAEASGIAVVAVNR